jgi:predicted Zn finger-like uncharacterized protein
MGMRLVGGGIVGLFCCGIYLAMLAVVFAGMWKTFEKMGKPGWAGIVPIYNLIIILEVVRKPLWWIALFLIPFANIVFAILVFIDLAKCFGKEAGFGVGLGLLPFVFFPILGFGSARFIGSEGRPDDMDGGRRRERDRDYDEDDRPRSRRRDRDDLDDDQFRGDEPRRPSPVQASGATAPPAPAGDNAMIQCPACQKRLKVPANVIGKKVKCPACAATFVAG